MNIKLHATLATLRSTRASSVRAIQLLGLLSRHAHGRADVRVSAEGEDLVIRFSFPDEPPGWPYRDLESCLVPALYGFDEIRFVHDGWLCKVDCSRLDAGDPCSVEIPVERVRAASGDGLSVVVGNHPSGIELLDEKTLSAFLADRCWVGTPKCDQSRNVTVRTLTRELVFKSPTIDRSAQYHLVTRVCHNRKIVLSGFVTPGRREIRMRHADCGVVRAEALRDAPRGVRLDVSFSVTPPLDVPVEARAMSEYEFSKQEIGLYLEELVASDLVRRCEREVAQLREREALDELEGRRKRLRGSSFVTLNGQVVYRVPENENDLVCLFMKLDGSKSIPFECSIMEYTSQAGIDAIGNFRLGSSDVLDMSVPIEFEYNFESYLAHGHPTGQTRLVICWKAEGSGSSGLRPTATPWRFEFRRGTATIPVVAVSKFPGIEIRKA